MTGTRPFRAAVLPSINLAFQATAALPESAAIRGDPPTDVTAMQVQKSVRGKKKSKIGGGGSGQGLK